MSSRRKSRQAVVSMLYAYDVGNKDPMHLSDEIFDNLKLKGEKREFAKLLFAGVIDHIEVIDKKIYSKLNAGWSFDRLGVVERAILRLATYEILFTQTDKPVVINEAIELTKIFADDSAPKLINGILEAIRKDAQ